MSTNRKLHQGDNLKQVSDDILLFILAKKNTPTEMQAHRDTLVALFEEAKQAYEKPQHEYYDLLAWVEKTFIYPFTRQRNRELLQAEGAVCSSEHNERMLILDIFCNVLRIGNCESTSFNTHLLDRLINQLNKYYSLDDDPNVNELGIIKAYGARVASRKTIRDLFIDKAEAILIDHKKELTEADALLRKKKSVDHGPGKLNTNADFLDELSKKISGKSIKTDSMLQGNQVMKKPEKVRVIEDYTSDAKQVDFKAMHENLKRCFGHAKEEVESKATESSRLAVKNPEIDTIPSWLFQESNDMQTRKPVKLEEKYPDAYKKISSFFSRQPIKLPEVSIGEKDVAADGARPGKS